MQKHQPRLLFDTVQLLEIGLLGSTVLVWLEGEKRTGAALEEGTEEIGGILQQPWHIFLFPLLTRSQLRDVCTVWSHFGVVCQGSARACVLGLGGCPVAVTVYPPGRGCLHSALLSRSPGCVEYSSAKRQFSARRTVYSTKRRFPPAKNEPLAHSRVEQTAGGILVEVVSLWGHVCWNPPPPQRKKAQALCGSTPSSVLYARHSRGEVEMAACCRRGHTAAECLLLRCSYTTFITFY